MSSAPDSTRMPYELSVEEIQLYVAPLIDLGNSKPRNFSWIKRWVLANSIFVEFDGFAPVLVNGLREPLNTQAIIRKELPADIGGLMPRLYGDFIIRDTHFIVMNVPAGKPAEDSSRLDEIALALLELDRLFREYWDKKPLPKGIAKTTLDLSPLEKMVEIDKSGRIAELVDKLVEVPLEKLTEYPTGIIHGDPGLDNAFISADGVVFTDGPCEFGPEIVDIAYLLQSAAATLECFDPEPAIIALANHYGKPIDEFREDLFLADIAAHINIIGWFGHCSEELLCDYSDLYGHLLDERLEALRKLIIE